MTAQNLPDLLKSTSTSSPPPNLSKVDSLQSKNKQTKGKPSKTNNIDDINTKLFLSNTIDGLENSEIVDKNLTTTTVFMMNVDDEKRKNPTSSGGPTFKKRRIEVEIDNDSDGDDFFRSTEELDAEMNQKNIGPPTQTYLGNLRANNAARVLKNDFLCLIDGDHNGNLKEVKKQNVVFPSLAR